MIKRFTYAFLIMFLSIKGFSLSLADLSKMALDSNPDIMAASADYEKEVLSAKYLNGAYVPRVTLSSSSTMLKNDVSNELPEKFSSNITYAQPLPGGTTISLEADYIFNSAKYNELYYLKQDPALSLTLSQSLLPFWTQGQIKDPVKLSAKKREDYYYNQLQYVKKNIWESLVQYYVYALIAKNEIAMYQNSVELYEIQIASIEVLRAQGKASQSAILEVENSKWNAEQNLMSAQSDYLANIQKLKTICGQNFNEELLEPLNEKEKFAGTTFIADNEKDPLEETYKLKLEILKNSRITEKQASAPVLKLSLQPELDLNATTKDEWKEAWKNMDSPARWTVGIGLDLSSMLSGIASQNKKKYQIEYSMALEAYHLYLEQRNFVLQQYKDLLRQYRNQQERIDFLYESACKELADYKLQFEKGEISKLDYESARVRVENCRLKKDSINSFVWLYEVFVQNNTYE